MTAAPETLASRAGEQHVEIFFQDGMIFSAAAKRSVTFPVAALIAKGFITDEQRNRALEIHARRISPSADLVILGTISEERLLAEMRAKRRRRSPIWSSGATRIRIREGRSHAASSSRCGSTSRHSSSRRSSCAPSSATTATSTRARGELRRLAAVGIESSSPARGEDEEFHAGELRLDAPLR